MSTCIELRACKISEAYFLNFPLAFPETTCTVSSSVWKIHLSVDVTKSKFYLGQNVTLVQGKVGK